MTPQEEFVRRLREQTPEFNMEDEVDVFLAWLKENGPDEWHRWAINWNWDHGTEIFEWIVAQPNCDKGTVLSIYYAAQPNFFGRYATVQEAITSLSGEEVVPLMVHICERWRDGAYPNYAYRPSEAVIEYLKQGEEALLAIVNAVPWDMPVGLATAGIKGEPNNFVGKVIDGIPVDMLRALGETWD